MSSAPFGKVIFCNAAIFRIKGAILADFAALFTFAIRATGNDLYSESPRVCRRLIFLRGLADEQTTWILPRSA